MGGLTTCDVTSSVAYQEIFGQGLREGRQEGRRSEAAALIPRLVQWRFGAPVADQLAPIESLSLARREALAEDLLDFPTPADLTAWLNRQNG